MNHKEVRHGNSPGESPGHPGSWLMVGAIIAVIVLGIAQGIPDTIEALGLLTGLWGK